MGATAFRRSVSVDTLPGHLPHRRDSAMKTIFAGALFFGVASVATATEIDLSKRTCQQFLQISKDETATIMSWLDGYFHDENNSPIIDTEEIAADAKSLSEYCTANPTVRCSCCSGRKGIRWKVIMSQADEFRKTVRRQWLRNPITGKPTAGASAGEVIDRREFITLSLLKTPKCRERLEISCGPTIPWWA